MKTSHLVSLYVALIFVSITCFVSPLIISERAINKYDKMSHRVFDKYLEQTSKHSEHLLTRVKLLEAAHTEEIKTVIQQKAKLIILDVLTKQSNKEKIPTPAEINRMAAQITKSSETWGVEPSLILALIHAESFFFPRAVSGAGAIGLTQVMPDTARDIFENDKAIRKCNLTHIECSIDVGTYYLSKMILRFNDIEHAVAAYNAGPTHARKVISGERDKFYKETEHYVDLVFMRLYPIYKERLSSD